VSKLGGVIAFSAEAGIWIAGAALIASAAGMHWSVDLPAVDLSALTGPSPSAAASGSPSASGAVKSPTPSATPTLAPIVQKFQAYQARSDFQFKATLTRSETGIMGGTPIQVTMTGTLSVKGGDQAGSFKTTGSGDVTTNDAVVLGNYRYVRANGGSWTQSTRSAAEIESSKYFVSPTLVFLDKGVEIKNGAQLHRLELEYGSAYSDRVAKGIEPTATGSQIMFTIWVHDDGAPVVFRHDGWLEMPIDGTPTMITVVQEITVTATSGVTITAPI
jgi:hypothetical protein